jgi:hypothetical protein
MEDKPIEVRPLLNPVISIPQGHLYMWLEINDPNEAKKLSDK